MNRGSQENKYPIRVLGYDCIVLSPNSGHVAALAVLGIVTSMAKEIRVFRKSILSLAVLTLAISACSSDTVVLSPTSYYAAYTPSVVNNAAVAGGMMVEVVGNPFDIPKDELESAVTGAMTGSHFGPAVNFLTTAPDGFRSAYRIVILFDPTQNYTENKLCKESQSLQPGTGENVKAHAALCAKGSALTGVSGRVGDVTGIDDPKFRRLISQITTNLLPPSNPDRRDGRSGIFIGF